MVKYITTTDIFLSVIVLVIVITNIVLACCIGLILPKHIIHRGWLYIGNKSISTTESLRNSCSCKPSDRKYESQNVSQSLTNRTRSLPKHQSSHGQAETLNDGKEENELYLKESGTIAKSVTATIADTGSVLVPSEYSTRNKMSSTYGKITEKKMTDIPRIDATKENPYLRTLSEIMTLPIIVTSSKSYAFSSTEMSSSEKSYYTEVMQDETTGNILKYRKDTPQELAGDIEKIDELFEDQDGAFFETTRVSGNAGHGSHEIDYSFSWVSST